MPKNTINKFQENEKVLCYHGPLLYEAKCMKIQVKEKQVKYFVHYQGWNKSWDEWVPEDRVLKINELSLQKQRELMDANNNQSKGNKQSKGGKRKSIDPKEVMSPNVPLAVDKKPKFNTPNNVVVNTVLPNNSELKENAIVIKDSDGQRKKRIRVEPTVEHEDPDSTKSTEMRIKIPDNLKQFLVDDWDLIRQKKLFRLPSKVSVDRILNDYVKHKNNVKSTPSKESEIKEVAKGIKEYFNTAIGTQLLYKLEKAQYKDQVKDPDEDPKASSIYGAFHLLRLFVKLGGFMAFMSLDEKSTQLITGHIHGFLKYLERNPSLFNVNDYESASAEYLKKIS